MSHQTPQEHAQSGSSEGERFGRYRLRGILGQGGMGRLYVAEQVGIEGFSKVVALKRILPHLADSQHFRAMFLNEARVAARLEHPNIVATFELGEVDGNYFISMEYLSGEDLAAILTRCQSAGPMPIEIAVALAQQSANGLHYAHEMRDTSGKALELVHRDVSPLNIFVTYYGMVKLLDFGIVKGVTDPSRTVPGVFKGKYAYCSPEQLDGGVVTRQTDIFCLGIVLWECLTGRRLFLRDTDAATIDAVRGHDIEPPSALRKDVPRELDQIVLQALSRQRVARFGTAHAFSEALDKFLAGRERAPHLPEHRPVVGVAVRLRPRHAEKSDRARERGRGRAQSPAELRRGPRAVRREHRPCAEPRGGAGRGGAHAVVEKDDQPGRRARLLGRRHRQPLHRRRCPSPRAPRRSAPPRRRARRRREWNRRPRRGRATPLAPAGDRRSGQRAGRHVGDAVHCALPHQGRGARGAAPVVTTASLTLASEPPGAQIFIDGDPSGMTTPYTLTGLHARRPIEVRLDKVGFRPVTEKIELRPGRDAIAIVPAGRRQRNRHSRRPSAASVDLRRRQAGRSKGAAGAAAGRAPAARRNRRRRRRLVARPSPSRPGSRPSGFRHKRRAQKHDELLSLRTARPRAGRVRGCRPRGTERRCWPVPRCWDWRSPRR